MVEKGSLQEQWSRQGYIVVSGIYDADRVVRLRALCQAILEQWRVESPETGKPGAEAHEEGLHCMRHLNHVGYFQTKPAGRIEMLEAIAAPSVLKFVAAILNEQPLFRCTSLFFNPQETSTDGSWHRDSQFSTKNDAQEQELLRKTANPATSVQLQIALERSDDLEFVPGSHRRWDTSDEYDIRKADGGANNRSNNMAGALRIDLAPGDAVAFNPTGLHRGRYHVDKRRRTLLLTYTATSAPNFDYFSVQPWFLADGYLSGLTPQATRFFEAYKAVYEKDWLRK